jgi:hypothetical protein
MDRHGLRSTSLSQAESHYRGRCAACGQPLTYRQEVVHLYGDAFHHACASNRPLHTESPQAGRGQGV